MCWLPQCLQPSSRVGGLKGNATAANPENRLQRGLSAAWLRVQAYDVNVRLRQDLKLEQERRQAAVKTLLGPKD